MGTKVSVLTPIYNVAKFLPQCLDSLVAQTMQDIEFICINDGSTDNSLEILEEYAKKDARIKIIDKENEGYGKSMNRGLAAAQGEYIGIVESDDFIDSNAFEELYHLAEIHQYPDLVKANYYTFDNFAGERFVENYSKDLCGKVFSPDDQIANRAIDTVPAIWSAIYRKNFLQSNNIKFLETPGASFQDTGFVFKSWCLADSFYITHDAFLHYRIDNAGSSVKTKTKVFNVCDEFHSIEKALEARPERRKNVIARLNVKKYATYRWNLYRIADDYRWDFLMIMHDEFKESLRNGELDSSLFTTERWHEVKTIIENPQAFYLNLKIQSDREDQIKVSVIMPVYNCGAYLSDALESLRTQTLKDIEVLVVDDGSTDESWSVIKEFCAKDSRFKGFHQANSGASAARNFALGQAQGKYLAFCDGDDIVPEKAYEKMYRVMWQNDADLVVGEMKTFDMIGADSFLRTKWLSDKDRIDKYDLDFNWSMSLCNKMFCAKKVQDLGLRFVDTSMSEDAIFFNQYLNHADRIFGAKTCVYKYRQHLPFEATSATQSFTFKTLKDYRESMEAVASIRKSGYENDLSAIDASTPSGRAKAAYLRAQYAFLVEDLLNRYISLSFQRFYRHIWFMSDDGFEYFVQQYKEGIENISEAHQRSIFAYHNDLRIEKNALLTKADLTENPLVSIAVLPGLSSTEFEHAIKSVYQQNLPAFELILSESSRILLPEDYTDMINIRWVSASKRSDFLNEALASARSGYLNIIEDPIYHKADTLQQAWNIADESYADFVSLRLKRIENGAGFHLRTNSFLFSDEYTSSPNCHTKYDVLDCTLNNKLLKVSRLREKDFCFSDSLFEDVSKLYDAFSFEKCTKIYMVSFLRDKDFLERVPSALATQYRAHYYLRKQVSYDKEKEEKKRKKQDEYNLAHVSPLKPRRKVLFTSNRENNRLSQSMQMVYDALPNVDKVIFDEPLPHSEDYNQELMNALRTAKVIVTDDYIHVLRRMKLRKDQSVVQLWHACGALKKFGLDYPGADITNEKMTHRQYQAVIVSDESVRSAYAGAFGINVNKVKALGVARTDLLLNEEYKQEIKELLFKTYPELGKKQVILYCPTFRQNGLGKQVSWDPRIDWHKLDDSLTNDQVFIVKEHPLEYASLVNDKTLAHVKTYDDLTTEDVMLVADLMITDCSSVVFDYSLLNKPILYYFPDFDDFDRDFYIDFPEDVGGTVIMDDQALREKIVEALKNPNEYLPSNLRDTMMSACDGHSTERIAAYIQSLLND